MADAGTEPILSIIPLTPRLALRDVRGVTKRNLLRILRTPQLMVISLAQPTIILLILRYVLAGAIDIPGVNYVDYVMPAVFIEAVLVGGMTTSVALAQDLQLGMLDRFRSLPMARSAFLTARTLADLGRNVVAMGFVIVLALVVGFRFHNSVGPCLAGVGLILLFGYCFTWIYASVGLAVKEPQTAQVAAILPMFILFFASSAIVPVATMPGWLQPFARNQPATEVINALRALFEGGAVASDLWRALVWCAGILTLFFAVALALYRRAVT